MLPKYLGAEEDAYTREIMQLLMLAAIHRVYEPGCKYEIMVCLVGGQGAGKSTFFRFLAIKDEWFSDDLKRMDDDNVYRKMQGHWIIEMLEMMATVNAKSIEDIKSFISRQKETYKIPYEKYRDKYYVIGESHLVYQGNKTESDDFYILTLAGLAEEMKYRGLHEADVVLAV